MYSKVVLLFRNAFKETLCGSSSGSNSNDAFGGGGGGRVLTSLHQTNCSAYRATQRATSATRLEMAKPKSTNTCTSTTINQVSIEETNDSGKTAASKNGFTAVSQRKVGMEKIHGKKCSQDETLGKDNNVDQISKVSTV